jgi:hypothetical protein
MIFFFFLLFFAIKDICKLQHKALGSCCGIVDLAIVLSTVNAMESYEFSNVQVFPQ